MEEMPMSVLRPVLCLVLVAALSGCGAKMMRCTSASGSWAIGRVADQDILDRIQAESGAKQIRTLADGETSSDIGMDRVTVHVNAQNLVTAVTCD
jgi:hypothetical protein